MTVLLKCGRCDARVLSTSSDPRKSTVCPACAVELASILRSGATVDEVLSHGWDEDGWHLRLSTDADEVDLRVGDVESARALVAAADGLREWVADADRERDAYRRATPAERAEVLGHDPEEDPGHPDPETIREGADLARKADREGRA